MKVTAIKCSSCNDIIYSRARHDFHFCTCGAVNIDGGFDYVRVGWRDKVSPPKTFQLDIGNISKQELFTDWNKRIDKYGVIHEHEAVQRKE